MHTRDHTGVTFSELLILVGVVGLLATMLLPVFARARAEARQAVCLANIRTIAQAIRMYLSENDGWFPPVEHRAEVLAYFDQYPGKGEKGTPSTQPHCHRAFHTNPYLRWPVILDPYLITRDVWQCPDARLQGGATFINGAEDWLSHLQEHEGQWGSGLLLCPDLSWPAGWGGETTDSLTQQRIALPITGKGRVASPGSFVQSIGVNRPEAAVIGREKNAETVQNPDWFVICGDAGATVDDFCVGTLAYPDLCHLECAGPGDWEADWENCPWSRQCGAVAEMNPPRVAQTARQALRWG